nr:hypothetical protein [Nanoarchaeum sp.]
MANELKLEEIIERLKQVPRKDWEQIKRLEQANKAEYFGYETQIGRINYRVDERKRIMIKTKDDITYLTLPVDPFYSREIEGRISSLYSHIEDMRIKYMKRIIRENIRGQSDK